MLVADLPNHTASSSAIRRLREMLPKRITLLVGGAGAPRKLPNGAERIDDLRQLDGWARRAAGRSDGLG